MYFATRAALEINGQQQQLFANLVKTQNHCVKIVQSSILARKRPDITKSAMISKNYLFVNQI